MKKHPAKSKKKFGLKEFRGLRVPYGSKEHKKSTKQLWDWLKS